MAINTSLERELAEELDARPVRVQLKRSGHIVYSCLAIQSIRISDAPKLRLWLDEISAIKLYREPLHILAVYALLFSNQHSLFVRQFRDAAICISAMQYRAPRQWHTEISRTHLNEQRLLNTHHWRWINNFNKCLIKSQYAYRRAGWQTSQLSGESFWCFD